MKIAFIALPQPPGTVTSPPLPLGYVAALLEQQRHIVRVYDLALSHGLPLADSLAPLRAFRPHAVVIEAINPELTAAIEALLADCSATLLRVGSSLRELAPGQVFRRSDGSPSLEGEQNIIFGALLALNDHIDDLPFPARHLLSLEQYPLFAPSGELQTVVLTGQWCGADTIVQRAPAQVVAELRSVAREHGIHHFAFSGPPLTHDPAWMSSLLDYLTHARLGVKWEASAEYERLDSGTLEEFRKSGCEALRFTFDAVGVLASQRARAALSEVVAQAHDLDIFVRAHIWLEPPYGAIPALVDMSATFGLDEVRFGVREPSSPAQAVSEDGEIAQVAEMARSRYQSSRSRHFFIERFGPHLGPMLWRFGRAGLLGRTWQRYARSGEDANATA